jgi:hypothetical protein
LDNSGERCRVEGRVTSLTAGISKEGTGQPAQTFKGFGYAQPGLVTSEEDGELSADLPDSDYVRSPLRNTEYGLGAFFPVNNGREQRIAIIKADGTPVKLKAGTAKRWKGGGRKPALTPQSS